MTLVTKMFISLNQSFIGKKFHTVVHHNRYIPDISYDIVCVYDRQW